jgi:hypothetical protein
MKRTLVPLLLGLVACGSRTGLIGFADLDGADTTIPVFDAASLPEGDSGSARGAGGASGTEPGAQSEPAGSASKDGSSVMDVVLPPLDAPLPPLDAPLSCPTPSAVIVGASCTLPPDFSCSASPVLACGGTTSPDCTCQSHAWACVTSLPVCDGSPCPPASNVIAGAGCTLSPDVSCSGSPLPACGGTTTPDCT